MSDQVCPSADQHPDERHPEHYRRAPAGFTADGSRMIAVTPERIAGRYIPAIPADSEDRSRD